MLVRAAKFIIFNAQFVVFNAKFIIFTHPNDRAVRQNRPKSVAKQSIVSLETAPSECLRNLRHTHDRCDLLAQHCRDCLRHRVDGGGRDSAFLDR